MSDLPNDQSTSASEWRGRIERCKSKRKRLIHDWAINVDYLRGKPFDEDSDEHRIYVNKDWSMARRKVAQLISQVPEVRLEPKRQEFTPAVPAFAKLLNDTLKAANVGDAVYEATKDCVNASGIGVVICGYEALTEDVQVPAIDLSTLPPQLQQMALHTGQIGGQQIPMQAVKRTTSDRFYVKRVSPSDLLWPVEFQGSNFDEAPWLGFSGLMSWAEAKNAFKLTDDQKAQVIGGKDLRQTLREIGSSELAAEPGVAFDQIFYWDYRFNPDSKYYKSIRRMVFVQGLDEPVIDEPWTGQRFDEQDGTYLGACYFPLRVLTLNYVSDDPIPPSDSAIARPQIQELIRSRSQVFKNRERSTPLRWFDTNRLDPDVANNLMRGEVQSMIPVNGDGSRVIGEVARANYPAEDFQFDRVASGDLEDSWGLGANQTGNFNQGQRSASEAQIIQSNFTNQIGFERTRVANFFVTIAEVIGGLLALYGPFDAKQALGPQDLQKLATWNPERIGNEFVYSVRVDSTVLPEAGQRIQQLMSVLNMTAKSGFINPQPLIEEILELAGLDPTEVMTQPHPPGPPPINVSMRLSGTEDLQNPLTLAFLMKTGQAPNPQELQAAMSLLQASQPQLPAPMGAPVGAPAPVAAPVPLTQAPNPNPDWTMAERIDKRISSE